MVTVTTFQTQEQQVVIELGQDCYALASVWFETPVFLLRVRRYQSGGNFVGVGVETGRIKTSFVSTIGESYLARAACMCFLVSGIQRHSSGCC